MEPTEHEAEAQEAQEAQEARAAPDAAPEASQLAGVCEGGMEASQLPRARRGNGGKSALGLGVKRLLLSSAFFFFVGGGGGGRGESALGLGCETVAVVVCVLFFGPKRLPALVRPAFDLVLRRIRSLKRCVQACGCKIMTPRYACNLAPGCISSEPTFAGLRKNKKKGKKRSQKKGSPKTR